MPCYLYRDRPFCYIWTDKKTGSPYLLIVEGHRIEHSHLVTGDRKRMKTLPIAADSDIDLEVIYEVLNLVKAIYSK